MPTQQEIAILAGGCFWGVQDLIRQLEGVLETCVGYTGGHTENPTYDAICRGDTGHAEAIQITFDPNVISFSELLYFFFRMHNPTTLNRQGNDIGSQYRSAIFVTSDAQKATAAEIIKEIDATNQWSDKITTEITEAGTFYPAEEEHQDYLEKNPNGYTCHWIRPA